MNARTQEAYRRALQFQAGRHQIDRLFDEVLGGSSQCTDVAVRTHVPVRIGFDMVLIPIDEADQIMRAIARAAWPNDSSPLEDEGYRAGADWWGTSSIARCHEDLHRQRDEAIEILQSFRHDDEARQEALKALTGSDLLIQVGDPL